MLKKFLLAVLALLMIFEEWLWDFLTLAGAWMGHVLRLEQFDAQLARSTPKQAVIALLIPVALVTPLNIAAVMLLAHGSIVSAVLLEIVAKLLGTLLIARVFRLVRPALMSFPWFASVYSHIVALLEWAHRTIRETALYRLSLAVRQALKRQAGRWYALARRIVAS